MTEETKRTDMTEALDDALREIAHWLDEDTDTLVPLLSRAPDDNALREQSNEIKRRRGYVALLRSLAARITEYREAELRRRTVKQDSTHERYADEVLEPEARAIAALLASCRGGETPNNPKQEGTE